MYSIIESCLKKEYPSRSFKPIIFIQGGKMQLTNYKTIGIFTKEQIESPVHNLTEKQVEDLFKKMGASLPVLYMESWEKCPDFLFNDSEELMIDHIKLRIVKNNTEQHSPFTYAIRVYPV
ncbi:MAG: hypothetical protein Q7U36_04515 [bacterium]|nr:hypothetical protein [bacterium]